MCFSTLALAPSSGEELFSSKKLVTQSDVLCTPLIVMAGDRGTIDFM
jgi:hypothetical protein